MLRTFFLAVLYFVSSTCVIAQEYIWPTDASRLFTSSFAESRGGRFHAGVDFKTWGKTGFPIFAIRDGYISRIRVSPFGYGRALYLTLDTGEIVVYGHLEKFSDEIEAYVKAEQKRRNNYDIQLSPKRTQFPVKQGDVIALSGESGVGYPHLHFELRDASSNPMNPLLKGYQVVDQISPRITKILIQPLDALSSVNGDFLPKMFWPTSTGNNTSQVSGAIVVSGRIGFGVDAFDQMDSVDNKYGVYRNELYIDDELVFVAQYDKFTYAANNQFDLDRDYRQRIYGNGSFYNLFRDFGNTLSFYSSRDLYAGVVDFYNSSTIDTTALVPEEIVAIPTGVKRVDGGAHTFKIVAQDYWGNASQVSGRFVVDGEELLARNENATTDTIYGPAPPNSLIFLNDANEVGPQKDIHLETRFYDRYLRIQLTSRRPLAEKPVVSGWLCSGKTYQMPILKRSSSYIGAWPLSGCDHGPLPLSIKYVTQTGDTLIQNEWIEFTTVPRGQSKSVSSHDGLCKLDFATNSLFKDIFVKTEKLETKMGEYDIVGNLYRIYPIDVPLDKGVTLSLAYPDSEPLPHKLGVYTKTGNKMRFVGNKIGVGESRISANITSFGAFSLVRDVDPPKIFSLSPADGSRSTNDKPHLRSAFIDELSGISGESNRLLKLDGKKVIAEYDPEASAIFYTPEEPLQKGEHTVEIVLQDQSGNIATRLNKFYID